jgi:hypothetical protein
MNPSRGLMSSPPEFISRADQLANSKLGLIISRYGLTSPIAELMSGPSQLTRSGTERMSPTARPTSPRATTISNGVCLRRSG